MSEPTNGAPDLAARLAEIDRRLGELQAELVPAHAPARAVDAAPDLDTKLLSSMRNLLGVAYEWLQARDARGRPARSSHSSDELSVAAGPFNGTDAVRGFEQALARIPGVTNVSVVGYEGANEAIFRVRLS